MDCLTLNLLMTTIVAPPSNASNWQMGFNSAFKGLNNCIPRLRKFSPLILETSKVSICRKAASIRKA